MGTKVIDSAAYMKMIGAGAASLRAHVDEINALNVFPIPDGDTGDNMEMTISGALGGSIDMGAGLGVTAEGMAKLMLLSARGNSGVILSQFFDGIAKGLSGHIDADTKTFAAALSCGVERAYTAVMTPTEGTVLTVARVATEAVCGGEFSSFEELLDRFLEVAERTLDETPEMLPVLKSAGVVDSGGAGLIRIFEGMRASLEQGYTDDRFESRHTPTIDIDKFDENSVLELGYCTEALVRLQNSKCDPKALDISVFCDFLTSVGDSVVAFKDGSIVKLHVHTFTPEKVLAFCRLYGEFLSVKIENMSLQHGSLEHTPISRAAGERKRFGTVAVASGDGIADMFTKLGADVVVRGGQSMNPSAGELKDAYGRANADVVFVFPNNSNVILTAKQAAELCGSIDVRVVETKNIGQGHAALAMMNPELGDVDAIYRDLTQATKNVITAEVSTCSRDTNTDGFSLYTGEYIGFIEDHILSADNDVCDTAKLLLDKIDFEEHEILIIICGSDSTPEETDVIREYVEKTHPFCEVYTVDGGQAVYNYIFVAE